jgi:hypothetical protein
MTFKTHKRFSIAFGYVLLVILWTMFMENSTDIVGVDKVVRFYTMFPVVLLAAKWGAAYPDLDHHWGSIADHNGLNFIISWVIRNIFRGKHRSRFTHSWDICLAGMCGWVVLIIYMGKINTISETTEIMLLTVVGGVYSGYISHLVSDMLNGVGVHILFFLDKVAFVPKKIGIGHGIVVTTVGLIGIATTIVSGKMFFGLSYVIVLVGVLFLGLAAFGINVIRRKGIVFNTGNEWEDICYRYIQIVNIGMGLFTAIVPFRGILGGII